MPYFIREDLTQIPMTTVVSTVTDDPLVLYNTWATELGLSTTETVYALNGDDVAWPIDVNGHFLKGLQTNPTANAEFCTEGALGFYTNPITSGTNFTASGGLTGVNRMTQLVDRPDFLYTFHLTGKDCETSGVKVQKTADITIISGTLKVYGSTSVYCTFAIRLEKNKITMVCSTTTGASIDHRLFGYIPNTDTVRNGTLELAQLAGTIRKIVFTMDGKYVLSGNINETSDIDTWRVTLSKCSTGSFISTTVVTGASYSMEPSFFLEACNITIAPKIDYQWSANKVAVVGDFVTPSNPDATPHLFKVSIAGTFETTEASWNLINTTTTIQGTATLTYVAALVNPVTIGPKLGTLSPI